MVDMRLVLCVLLLSTIAIGGVNAEWTWQEQRQAKPQPFQVFDEYVIAVGEYENLQTVQASDIVKALEDGKEIRLMYAKIEGNVMFRGEVKKDVYFFDSTFSGEADFSSAKFSERAEFWSSTFSGVADFSSAMFSREANFSSAKFSGDKFSGEADFSSAKFSALANFWIAKFSGVAYFSSAKFSERAYFRSPTFSEWADFSSATFSGEADFTYATFSGEASFGSVTFEKEILFTFKRLERHIVFDEVFFRRLIKHYQDIGDLGSADDAYYLYRKERRRTLNPFYRIAELFFLDITFGYGVRPWTLLRSFFFLWVFFGFYYIGFLKHKTDCRTPGWRAWSPFFHRFRGFGWSLLHSLDIITPGIDLHSLTSLKGGDTFNEKSKGVIWGQRIQKFLGWYLLALFFILFGKIWIR